VGSKVESFLPLSIPKIGPINPRYPIALVTLPLRDRSIYENIGSKWVFIFAAVIGAFGSNLHWTTGPLSLTLS